MFNNFVNPQNIALIDGDKEQIVTYGELEKEVAEYKKQFRKEKSLIFCLCQNNIATIAAYLAILESDHACLLLDKNTPQDMIEKLIDLYNPHYVIDPGKEIIYRNKTDEPHLHPDLKLLMSTSGTTASPKLIRLSLRNIESNAKAIAKYLKIDQQERAIASLPMHYSYGLSVINSHLLKGASIVLTDSSIVQAPFWKIFNKHECTSFAGVPYTYQILDRLRFEKFDLPTLKTMTQAGGRLDKPLIEKFWQYMNKNGGKFFVMYGQTEASARISYLDPKFLPQKLGSIGKALDGGELKIDEKSGELIYHGDNVMLGYAENKSDLAMGDELNGVLKTGDLGYIDDDGFFFLTGRLKRISKVYGLRINLDEMEEHLHNFSPLALTGSDERIFIHLEKTHSEKFPKCIEELAIRYKLHKNTFELVEIDKLPRSASGKIEYSKLKVSDAN